MLLSETPTQQISKKARENNVSHTGPSFGVTDLSNENSGSLFAPTLFMSGGDMLSEKRYVGYGEAFAEAYRWSKTFGAEGAN